MALYDMTDVRGPATISKESLVPLQPTSFAAEKVQERAHLQAALRDRINVIGEDLFVIAEEFGDFEGVSRRIDLLCLDRDCRLVVVELKRTADGGHMELQALRYAAMVSTMTFAQVVRSLAKYRAARELPGATEESAATELRAWLDLDEDEEPEVARDVGIVLASEDFSNEITTTVLWLNEFHNFDIRCVRLKPYLLDDRMLLDVQQVVPFPEASAYTVRVREKERVERTVRTPSGADRTKFVVVTPTGQSEPLPKRWAILRLVAAMAEAGVGMDQIAAILPASKTVRVPGVFNEESDRWAAIQEHHGKPDPARWHVGHPIEIDGDSWVLHSNWGSTTRGFFKALTAIAPAGFDVREDREDADLG